MELLILTLTSILGISSDALGRAVRVRWPRNGGHMFDAIDVGARCAGYPTAMLLARRGYKVLLVD